MAIKQQEGFEPSEVFTATAMFFSESVLTTAKSDVFNVVNFFSEAVKKLTDSEGGVVFGSGTEKAAFESYFTVDPGPFPEGWQLTNMVQGISAALAIKKWLSSKRKNPMAQTVYMTGKQWPSEVAPLEIEARGFKSYNSSDIIVKPVGTPNGYYGVSLKKKPTKDSVDPTMINKAFDTVLQDNTIFGKLKTGIVDERIKFFGNVLRDAVAEGHIHLGRLTGGKIRDNKWLFSGHSTDDRTIHNMAKDRAFIDTKGSLKMPEIIGPLKDPKGRNNPGKHNTGNSDDWGKAAPGQSASWNNYGDSALGKSQLSQRNDTMRKYVNSQLGKSNCPLYAAMLKVMNEYADVFGEQLVSVTLRTDILKEIERKLGVKRFGELDIGFALVTGIGKTPKVSTSQQIAKKDKEIKKTLLDISEGKAYDIECVLEGLNHLDKKSSNKQNNYRFVLQEKEEAHVDDDGPAKLIFDLLKNDTPILNMELRFKGGFTSQPQFFGYMTKEFKSVLTTGKCL